MGIVITLVTVLLAIYIYYMSKNQFGGMSGDISGYWLQITELATLAVFIIIKRWRYYDTGNWCNCIRKVEYVKSLGYSDSDIADGVLDERPVLNNLQDMVF